MRDKVKVQPVILCGGSGSRLWPLSRSGFPKQFLCLTGQESLFQQAIKRVMDPDSERFQVARPVVVAGEEHRFLVLEQLRDLMLEPSNILLEPFGRNTAPALTLAALAAIEGGEDPVLVVTPADQGIQDPRGFNKTMRNAIYQAAKAGIVILGIKPDRPETGYGYIQTNLGAHSDQSLVVAERFVEKPDAAAAQAYLNHGGYYWNAGIFVLKASVWMAALEAFRPDILKATTQAWSKRNKDTDPSAPFVRPGKAEFASIPSESIDYAVMEHCPGSKFPINLAPLNVGWSDLGAWDAVWSVLKKDENGNTQSGDVLAMDTNNSLVYSTSRLVSLLGVENLIVVETPDAVLVTNKSRSQDVKQIVNALKHEEREERLLHRKVHRPWGWYDTIDGGENFKVKRIQVKPGARLSLQKHHHRAEHWVIVKGTAKITCGEKTIVLNENQSTYIPLGETHRLENPAKVPLEIIEVQSGKYLGEDDIVRLEDSYGR